MRYPKIANIFLLIAFLLSLGVTYQRTMRAHTFTVVELSTE